MAGMYSSHPDSQMDLKRKLRGKWRHSEKGRKEKARKEEGRKGRENTSPN